jgi:hypothetical protein
MSLGQEMALSYSWKQKINTKSSTEAELVRVDDSLGYILLARYFKQELGFDMEESLLYQDNMRVQCCSRQTAEPTAQSALNISK